MIQFNEEINAAFKNSGFSMRALLKDKKAQAALRDTFNSMSGGKMADLSEEDARLEYDKMISQQRNEPEELVFFVPVKHWMGSDDAVVGQASIRATAESGVYTAEIRITESSEPDWAFLPILAMPTNAFKESRG